MSIKNLIDSIKNEGLLRSMKKLDELYELAINNEQRVAGIQAERDQLAAENASMDDFVDAMLAISWDGGSADGSEIEFHALKHGLIREEIYSKDEHENMVSDPGNFEDGDLVYCRVETPATERFLAEQRAQGVEMFADLTDKVSTEEDFYDNDESSSTLKYVAKQARLYAAQLRNEVKV